MAQGNQDSKVVVATVVSTNNDSIVLNCEEWGEITIKRGKNWDGGIYWDGALKGLKSGDNVDLLRTYANSASKTPLYGIYTLGSLKDSPARGKEQTLQEQDAPSNAVKYEHITVVKDETYDALVTNVVVNPSDWRVFAKSFNDRRFVSLDTDYDADTVAKDMGIKGETVFHCGRFDIIAVRQITFFMNYKPRNLSKGAVYDAETGKITENGRTYSTTKTVQLLLRNYTVDEKLKEGHQRC